MKEEYNKVTAVLKRGLRAFVAGFAAAIVTVPLWNGNLHDAKSYAVSLLTAGIVGGIMAIDKMIRG